MDKEEQIAYLANVYHVLLADGQVERVEDRAYEEMARDIRAGYFERKRAAEAAGSDGFQLRLVGRLSERLRNLEDMLFAAFCNGTLDRAEKGVIKQYAQQLGINQQQLDVIKDETKQRYAQFKAKGR